MGCGQSKAPEELEAEKMDAMFARDAEEDHKEESSEVKLLLLGAGESGKSTIFRQLRFLYGKGIPEEERRSVVPFIHTNVVESIVALVEQSDVLGHRLGADVAESAAVVRALPKEGDEVARIKLTAELAAHVQRLWADDGIQRTYARRASFQIPDSAAYFFGRIEEIIKPDYVPTQEDMLRVRLMTTGAVQEWFTIEGVKFRVFDVGGQKTERRKWLHVFDDVTAVIFIVAASEYDQVLREDGVTNRMVDSLNLFREICNSPWLAEKDIILFFNKLDLFREKIERVDIRQELPDGSILFSDYTGGRNFEAGIDYILRKYVERNENPDKEIHYMFTTATDKKIVEHVFTSCQKIITSSNLKEGGFMDEDS